MISDTSTPWLAVVIGVGVAVAVLLRQPIALLRPQWLWEEAAVFWAPTFTLGVASLWEPWAGYLQVVPRAAFLVARVFPAEIAPVAAIVLHAALIGAVAAFIAQARHAISDDRVRVAFAASIAILPAWEPYISALSAQWFLALLLVVMAYEPVRRWHYPVVAVAGLSGVAPVIVTPVYLWRRDPRAIVLVPVAIIQTAAILSIGRNATPTEMLPVVAVLAVVGAGVLVAARPPMAPALALPAVATLVLGAASMNLTSRYLFLAAAMVMLVAIVLALRSRAGVVAAVAVVGLSALAFFTPPAVGYGWTAQARCIGSPTPCRVEVIPPEWSVDWQPGYRPPIGMTRDGLPRWPDGSR